MIVPFDIKPNSNILISGCGGGFDVFCGVPIGLELESQGHNVVYSNYSFTVLKEVNDASWIKDDVLSIDEKSGTSTGYLPERVFSRWYFKKFGESKPVYSYSQVGVKSLIEIFDFIQEKHSIDYHFVIDGGSDGIFRGDEFNLGSPSIDSISIIAAEQSKIKNKFYILSAFGTEGVDKEVSHSEVLERMSDAIKNDAMLGISSILNNQEIANNFIDLYNNMISFMPSRYHSTIVSSIIYAIKGFFGDTSVNSKTLDRKVWVSPLTTILWFFKLDEIAKNKYYYETALESNSTHEMFEIINNTWENIGHNEQRNSIPI